MDVLVIGGSGLVGTNLLDHCEDAGHDTIGTYHSDPTEETTTQLDKTDPEAVEAVITEHQPDAIFDTAAFHAVDDCEDERDRAWTVNAAGTRNVARAANEVGAHLLYLSTDYVFPGQPDEAPYTESDPVAPLNYYARTKYAAEQAARIADRYTVLRPSVIYGLANDNFATWARSELEAGNEIGIVDDQVSRPTYAPDLAEACLRLAEKGVTGLYHATGPESLSRYEFTRELARVFEYDPHLVSPITTEELGQKAPRPADSSLDSTRLYETIGSRFDSPSAAFGRMRDQATSPVSD